MLSTGARWVASWVLHSGQTCVVQVHIGLPAGFCMVDKHAQCRCTLGCQLGTVWWTNMRSAGAHWVASSVLYGGQTCAVQVHIGLPAGFCTVDKHAQCRCTLGCQLGTVWWTNMRSTGAHWVASSVLYGGQTCTVQVHIGLPAGYCMVD